MGRPLKPHTTPWGETLVGIIPLGNGRWRISETGERFTEHDEFKAITYFKSKQKRPQAVFIPVRVREDAPTGTTENHPWNIQVDTVAKTPRQLKATTRQR
jgi:hypothetical protein